MINKNELRIGNYITDIHSENKTPFAVTSIGKTIVRYGKRYSFSSKYQNIEPVWLTEEIILKCGFEKIPHFTVTNSMVMDLGRGRYLSISDVDNCNQMTWLQCVEKDKRKITDLICVHNYDYDGWLYLHKLQNIYYALTGKELNIKL